MLPGWPESEVTPRHIYSLLLPMKVRKFYRRSWAQGKNYVALSPGALKRRSITLITLSDDRSDRSVLAKLEAELQAALTTRELPNDRSQEEARQNALRLEETANSPTTCLASVDFRQRIIFFFVAVPRAGGVRRAGLLLL